VAQAIDADAINKVLMAGMAVPASQLIPAGLSGFSEANDTRPARSEEAACALLAEAGHADGFAFDLKCTIATSTTRRSARH
jgi:peptide/nickel transport system substrate-binding protein